MAYLNPFNLTMYKNKTDKLAYSCPWSILVGDGIVLMKNGSLCRSFLFSGPDIESTSADRIQSLSACFNNEIKRLGAGWGIQFEAQRYTSNEYPGAKFDNPAAFLIDRQREINFSFYGEHFESKYYITFTWQMPDSLTSKAKGLFFQKSNIHDGLDTALVQNWIDSFITKTDKITASLSSRVKIKALNAEECVTYLHSTVSLDWHNMRLPKSYRFFLDHFITDTDLETSMTMKLGKNYIPILAVNDFPSETYPAIFDNLNKCMIPYRWSTRFICMEKNQSLKMIDKYQKRFYSARKSLGQYVLENTMDVHSGRTNQGAMAQESDTGDAQTEVMMDILGYGYYNSNIMVWDENYDKAMEKAKYIAGIIGSAGFSVKEETLNAFFAFLSMQPGNMYANVRQFPLSTGNLSHIIPLSSIWSGMKSNNFTKEIVGIDIPHVICSTDYGIPHFLNLNIGDVGHTWISGRTGAGKSTLLSLLELQWLKYPRSQVFIFDKDLSSRGTTIAVGGTYYEPGKDTMTFQPLRLLDSPSDIQWASLFIECLLSEQKVTITAGMRKEIYNALQLLSGKEKHERTLSSFHLYCNYKNPETGMNDIREGISPYTMTGQFGSIFDADESSFTLTSWTMFEMGTLMNLSPQAVAPAMMYIFRELESQFNANRLTLLVLDEAWMFLKNTAFANQIVDWLKTLRKKHVFVVFATQEVEDAAQSAIASTIISQCVSKIYLSDHGARTPLMKKAYQLFGLEDSEIDIIAEARPRQDYFFKNPLGCRMIQLDLDPLQLAILTSDHKLLNQIETKHGKNTGTPLVFDILQAKKIKYEHLLT